MLRRLRQHLHRKPWRSSPLNACGCQQHPSNSCSHEYSESGLSEWRRYLAPQTAIRQRIETRARLDEKATQKGFGSDLRLQSTPYLRKRRLRCSFFRESCSDVRTLSLSLSLFLFQRNVDDRGSSPRSKEVRNENTYKKMCMKGCNAVLYLLIIQTLHIHV